MRPDILFASRRYSQAEKRKSQQPQPSLTTPQAQKNFEGIGISRVGIRPILNNMLGYYFWGGRTWQ